MMQAGPFVRTLAAIEETVERITLDVRSATLEKMAVSISRNLSDLWVLVRDALPLPYVRPPLDRSTDEAVLAALTRLATDSVDDDAARSLGDTGRVRIVESATTVHLVVPLGCDPPVSYNWFLLFGWLRSKLSTVVDSLETLADRFRIRRATNNADTCAELRESIAETTELLSHVLVSYQRNTKYGTIEQWIISLQQTADELLNHK
jgi:hypothetical protein